MFAEVKYAWRRSRRSIAQTLACIVALACPFAAALAAFSVIEATLHAPIRLRNASEVGVVAASSQTGRRLTFPFSAYLSAKTSLDAEVAASRTMATLLAMRGRTVDAQVVLCSSNYLSLAAAPMQAGRDLLEQDDLSGQALVGILSDRAWTALYERAPAAIGDVVKVNGKKVQVVGVAGRGFRGLSLTDEPLLFLPLHAIESLDDGPDYFGATSKFSWLRVTVRTRSATLSSEQAIVIGGMGAANDRLSLIPLATAAIPDRLRPDVERFAIVLGFAVAVLFVVGGLIAGLILLIRTEARATELAVIRALGARPRQILFGCAADSLFVAICAGVISLPVSRALLLACSTGRLPGNIAVELLDVRPTWLSLCCYVGLVILAAALVGLVAGTFVLSREPLSHRLRSGAAGVSNARSRRLQVGFVVVQVAMSLVLCNAASLFVRSVAEGRKLGAGVNAPHLFSARVSVGALGYEDARSLSFFDQLTENISRQAEISGAALALGANTVPAKGRVQVDDSDRENPVDLEYISVDSRFFGVLGLPAIRGRLFVDTDRTSKSPAIAVVSESMARWVDPLGTAVGHWITDSTVRPARRMQVVGVVADTVRSTRQLSPLVVYSPLEQRKSGTFSEQDRTLIVRSRREPEAAMKATAQVVRELEPALDTPKFTGWAEGVDRELATQRMGAVLLSTLGIVATVLSALGAASVVVAILSARRREFGIRFALGAGRANLLKSGSMPLIVAATVGIAIGVICAIASQRLVKPFLFGVPPVDRWSLAISGLLVVFGVTAASSRILLRFSKPDPSVLRLS